MGYTTKFTGCINLSRALTLKEAKELLEIADLDRAEVREITGTDAYLQWVPTETLVVPDAVGDPHRRVEGLGVFGGREVNHCSKGD